MSFPTRFDDLPPYSFARLRALLDPHPGGAERLELTIGEPRHAMPPFVGEVLAANLDSFAKYPANNGTDALLDAIQGWIVRRYDVDLAHENLMALNGTREGLFNAALALMPEKKAGGAPHALIPNPFYQVYAIGSMMADAVPTFLPAGPATGFLPDYAALAPEVLDRTGIAFICSPANPQGAVASEAYLHELLTLAERHDFTVFSDECYSEIWRDAPPTGILQVVEKYGHDPDRALAFHSLSKRSNLPGLRSGFVAGGVEAMKRVRQLRAYGGAPLPEPLQAVAAATWADEGHVEASRVRYQEKYRIAEEVFDGIDGFGPPEAGFFLWLPVGDGEQFALDLWRASGVRVLPGGYLSRSVGGETPGAAYIRVAMVAPEDDLRRGLIAIRDLYLTQNKTA